MVCCSWNYVWRLLQAVRTWGYTSGESMYMLWLLTNLSDAEGLLKVRWGRLTTKPTCQTLRVYYRWKCVHIEATWRLTPFAFHWEFTVGYSMYIRRRLLALYSSVRHWGCTVCESIYIYIYIYIYPRRNVPDFGRVFLILTYTDITQNTYVQSWTVTEIMARGKCGLLARPHTVISQLSLWPCVWRQITTSQQR